MANNEFDPNWPHGHVTRDGRKARVLCTDRAGRWPLVALIESAGYEDVISCTREGRNDETPVSEESPLDLFNAPAPVIRHSRWANIYAASGWSARREADRGLLRGRLGLIEIIYEKGRPVDVKLHKADGGEDAHN